MYINYVLVDMTSEEARRIKNRFFWLMVLKVSKKFKSYLIDLSNCNGLMMEWVSSWCDR